MQKLLVGTTGTILPQGKLDRGLSGRLRESIDMETRSREHSQRFGSSSP